jgi:hypothetical protein
MFALALACSVAQVQAQPRGWYGYGLTPEGYSMRIPPGGPRYADPRFFSGPPRGYGCCGEGPNVDGGAWSHPGFWDYRRGYGGRMRPMYRDWWDR